MFCSESIWDMMRNEPNFIIPSPLLRNKLKARLWISAKVTYHFKLFMFRVVSHQIHGCTSGPRGRLPLSHTGSTVDHDNTMTSKQAYWRLRWPASRFFTQPFIQAQIKEIIKVPRHWPLCGEFIGDRWIPRTKGHKRGKYFHLMTSSWL